MIRKSCENSPHEVGKDIPVLVLATAVITVQVDIFPGSVMPTTRLLLSGDDTVFLVSLDGVGDLVEAHTRKTKYLR